MLKREVMRLGSSYPEIILRDGKKTKLEEATADIAVQARAQVMRRHRVLNLMTHVDPRHRPDLDHPGGRVKVMEP